MQNLFSKNKFNTHRSQESFGNNKSLEAFKIFLTDDIPLGPFKSNLALVILFLWLFF